MDSPNIQALLRKSFRLRLGRLMRRTILLNSIQMTRLVPRHSRHSTSSSSRSTLASIPLGVGSLTHGSIVGHGRAVGGDGKSTRGGGVSTWAEGGGGSVVGLGSEEGTVGFGSLRSPESEEEIESRISVGEGGEGVLETNEEEGRKVGQISRQPAGRRFKGAGERERREKLTLESSVWISIALGMTRAVILGRMEVTVLRGKWT